MGGREFKTKDPATARHGSGRRAWSCRAGGDGSTRRDGGRGAGALFLAATPCVDGLRVDTLPQLTHVRGRERLAARCAIARGIQLVGDAACRPARGLAVAHVLQQGCHIGHLSPGAHRSPQLMCRHRSARPMQLDPHLVAGRWRPDHHALQEQVHHVPFVRLRCLPKPGEIVSQGFDLGPLGGAQSGRLRVLETMVLLFQGPLGEQTFFSVAFQRAGHQAILRLYSIVLPKGAVRFLTRALHTQTPVPVEGGAFAFPFVGGTQAQFQAGWRYHLQNLSAHQLFQRFAHEALHAGAA